jgi:hypothetical protein
MTYSEAFDWIFDNAGFIEGEDFDSFTKRVRELFPNQAQGLIDSLVNGVKTDWRQRTYQQLTLEEFFRQLRPQD